MLSEWIVKTDLEISQMRIETEEIQKFIYTLQGYYVPNIYTDLIADFIFGKSAKQLREEYGITKKDNLINYFSQDELQRIQNAEMLVSSLVGYGWGYTEIKEFIMTMTTRLVAA